MKKTKEASLVEALDALQKGKIVSYKRHSLSFTYKCFFLEPDVVAIFYKICNGEWQTTHSFDIYPDMLPEDFKFTIQE